MNIHVDFVFPPIPCRNSDYEAYEIEYNEGMPIGRGRTEEEAINDLLDQMDEK